MERYRLIGRVPPFEHEALSSFLMRASSANHYQCPQDVLVFALNAKKTNPQVLTDQIEKLADYTRTTVPEIAQLSGISKRFPKIGLAWQVCNEWISKTAFLALKQTHVCPKCLAEEPYLRGEWALILNTACWRHNSQLIRVCPNCQRLLTIARALPQRCACGCDLRSIQQSAATPEEILLARLIARRNEPSLRLDSPCLPDYQIDNLAGLSLDGLCLSLWFLGHDLFGQFPLGTGRGHQKLSREDVLTVIKSAFWLLSDWPSRLESTLQHLICKSPASANDDSIIHMMGPMHRYYRRHIETGDARFISQPYETYLHQICSKLSRRYRPSHFDSPQLEFRFD